MVTNNRSINFFQKVQPDDSFWNWINLQQSRKNNKNSMKWSFDEIRNSAIELFNPNLRRKSESENTILGLGAGAGIGCGVGFGLGLVGGFGFYGEPRNHLGLGFGFGFGCGIGAGFGYGQGFGYGSSWESIKTDILEVLD